MLVTHISLKDLNGISVYCRYFKNTVTGIEISIPPNVNDFMFAEYLLPAGNETELGVC